MQPIVFSPHIADFRTLSPYFLKCSGGSMLPQTGGEACKYLQIHLQGFARLHRLWVTDP